jgi:hypothetical protein
LGDCADLAGVACGHQTTDSQEVAQVESDGWHGVANDEPVTYLFTHSFKIRLK